MPGLYFSNSAFLLKSCLTVPTSKQLEERGDGTRNELWKAEIFPQEQVLDRGVSLCHWVHTTPCFLPTLWHFLMLCNKEHSNIQRHRGLKIKRSCDFSYDNIKRYDFQLFLKSLVHFATKGAFTYAVFIPSELSPGVFFSLLWFMGTPQLHSCVDQNNQSKTICTKWSQSGSNQTPAWFNHSEKALQSGMDDATGTEVNVSWFSDSKRHFPGDVSCQN